MKRSKQKVVLLDITPASAEERDEGLNILARLIARDILENGGRDKKPSTRSGQNKRTTRSNTNFIVRWRDDNV